jgi:hypothetical protein
VLVNKAEKKVTSSKLTKYDVAAAFLDTATLLFLLSEMQT